MSPDSLFDRIPQWLKSLHERRTNCAMRRGSAGDHHGETPGPTHHADGYRGSQGLSKGGAVSRTLAANKLRVLVLTDQGLVPDKPRSQLRGRERESSRRPSMTCWPPLKRLGHPSQLRCARRRARRHRQGSTEHRATHHLQSGRGTQRTTLFRPARRELPGTAQAEAYRLQSSRPHHRARQALAKKVLAYHRLPVPRFAVIPKRKKILVPKRLRFPMFVKPLNVEGSEGISRASLVQDMERLLERVAFIHGKVSSPALVEEFIDGRENWSAPRRALTGE
jgi:hypothetical protein